MSGLQQATQLIEPIATTSSDTSLLAPDSNNNNNNHTQRTTYAQIIAQSDAVKEMIGMIMNLLESNDEACERYRGIYDEFKQLWQHDRKAAFAAFILRDMPKERRLSMSVQESFIAPDKPKEYFCVNLQEFDRVITQYDRIRARLSAIEDRHREGLVNIDVKPLRIALRETCKRWKDMFSDYLVQRIKSDLNELNAFMSAADKGLEVEVLDGDVDTLKSVMK